MRGESGDNQRLLHILDAISEIESFVRDVSFEVFQNSSLIKSACIFQLSVIGEAVNHLSEVLKEKHPDIEWKAIKGFRNIAAHEYWGISYNQVWKIIIEELPVLKSKMIEMGSDPGE